MAKLSKTNINTADQETLAALPGLGYLKAKRIIKYRQRQGYFKSLSDLTNIRGVDVHTLEFMKSVIEVKAPKARSANAKKEAIHFYGEPMNMNGNFELVNRSNEVQKRFFIQFEPHEKLRFLGKAGEILKVRSYVEAGQKKNVSITFSVDQATPPGTYTANMIIENERVEAVLHVVEKIQVSMGPDFIFIEAAPGASVEKTIYVTNQGNVPLTFKDPGAIIIEDEYFECRAIRGTVRSMKEVQDFNEALKLAASELEKLYDEAGGMRVRLTGEQVTIRPKQTVKINLVFTLGSKLRRGNYYSGAVRFYDDSVIIKVHPIKDIIIE